MRIPKKKVSFPCFAKKIFGSCKHMEHTPRDAPEDEPPRSRQAKARRAEKEKENDQVSSLGQRAKATPPKRLIMMIKHTTPLILEKVRASTKEKAKANPKERMPTKAAAKEVSPRAKERPRGSQKQMPPQRLSPVRAEPSQAQPPSSTS